MRVLVFAGDPWHAAEIVQSGLAGLKQRGFDFALAVDIADVDTERLGEYPVVILAKANPAKPGGDASWMSESTQEVFRDFVRGGGGLLALHSGAAGYADAAILRRLLGGAFSGHPEPCPVRIEPLASHPLAQGCEAFESVDEQYVMELDDDRAEVFLVTESEHGRQPAGWIRREGDGRVCVMTPGHEPTVWSHPSYRQLLFNAMRWCGGAA